MTSRINHVSVNAIELQESVGFYVELFGAEPIPTPNFGLPVQWLALDSTLLHLFERDVQPTSHHHFAVGLPLALGAPANRSVDHARTGTGS